MDPLVTIVVPVCGTAENLFESCLLSLCVQDFEQLEIIVVDDNGRSAAQKACRSFLTSFIRDHKRSAHTKNIRYLAHDKNRGLATARRTGFENARGRYCMTVDSDDTLCASDAVSRMYAAAMGIPGGFDIVQCGCLLTGTDESLVARRRKTMAVTEQPVVRTVLPGTADMTSVFFSGTAVSLFLWAKLFKREPVLNSLSDVPDMYCIMAEDLLLSYFIARGTHSYCSIPDQLYSYTVGNGITGIQRISDPAHWRRLCSVAGVFTAITYDLQERPFPPDSPVPQIIRESYFEHLMRNAFALEHRVDKTMYEEAAAAFIDAWGEENAKKAISSVHALLTRSEPDV